MRKLLTLAIPMLLGVGLLTAAIHSDPQNKRLQAGVTAETRSLPAVIEEAAAPATTTSTAAPETTTTTAAPAPTTTTTLAPVTTTTARPRSITPVTSAPRPRPRPTTTTTAAAPAQTQAAAPQPQMIDCGTGSASAKANLINVGPGRYALTATVVNESTKAIELDSLIVTADYGAAGKKQYSVAVSGRRVDAQPGQAEMTFEIPESESTTAPTNFVISDFRFHTAGLPECTSR